ncbi:hypothetical protein ACFSMW_16605 [Virgibacillus halophilus]|uniref:hypothetical protein n=1 Tax=Tigheibacillus halophilus TaxID=361280 RepID=UPI003630D4A0
MKVHSGTEHLWPQLIAVILKKINYSNLDTIDRLQKLCPKEIRNDNGQIVGEIKILL